LLEYFQGNASFYRDLYAIIFLQLKWATERPGKKPVSSGLIRFDPVDLAAEG